MINFIRSLIKLFESLPYSFLALLGRLSIGLVFWNSARTKVEGWDVFNVNETTLQLFTDDYKVPLLSPYIAALMAQLAEHAFSILIIIGLATRFSALALVGMTLVIEIFVYPDAYVLHGTWATILLMLVKFGAGKLSVDELVKKYFLVK